MLSLRSAITLPRLMLSYAPKVWMVSLRSAITLPRLMLSYAPKMWMMSLRSVGSAYGVICPLLGAIVVMVVQALNYHAPDRFSSNSTLETEHQGP